MVRVILRHTVCKGNRLATSYRLINWGWLHRCWHCHTADCDGLFLNIGQVHHIATCESSPKCIVHRRSQDRGKRVQYMTIYTPKKGGKKNTQVSLVLLLTFRISSWELKRCVCIWLPRSRINTLRMDMGELKGNGCLLYGREGNSADGAGGRGFDPSPMLVPCS